jgi:hypothetical protein
MLGNEGCEFIVTQILGTDACFVMGDCLRRVRLVDGVFQGEDKENPRSTGEDRGRLFGQHIRRTTARR